jgi:hypothetical protein
MKCPGGVTLMLLPSGEECVSPPGKSRRRDGMLMELSIKRIITTSSMGFMLLMLVVIAV